MHARVCTYGSVRDARAFSFVSEYTLILMGSVTRAEALAGLVEGTSTGSVQTTKVYVRDTTFADSNGPGSTGGRAQNV